MILFYMKHLGQIINFYIVTIASIHKVLKLNSLHLRLSTVLYFIFVVICVVSNRLVENCL